MKIERLHLWNNVNTFTIHSIFTHHLFNHVPLLYHIMITVNISNCNGHQWLYTSLQNPLYKPSQTLILIIKNRPFILHDNGFFHCHNLITCIRHCIHSGLQISGTVSNSISVLFFSATSCWATCFTFVVGTFWKSSFTSDCIICVSSFWFICACSFAEWNCYEWSNTWNTSCWLFGSCCIYVAFKFKWWSAKKYIINVGFEDDETES